MDRSRTRNVEKRGLRNRVDMEESWTSHYNEEQRVGARCLLGLALRGYLVCGGFHLLVASQVVVLYRLQVLVQLVHERNSCK